MGAAKTSESHPLRIDTIRVRGTTGSIGLTFCPGKQQLGAHSGTWLRDLNVDLTAIRDSGAVALVSLMEEPELASVQVPANVLAAKAAELGLEWHHLPIRDVSVPDDDFEDVWTYAGMRLRSLLRGGGKIVIHCLGGLGRTGTIAARLLVELGQPAEEAVTLVRAARPGSIETARQEAYVRQCHPVADLSPSPGRDERALACLLGGALGDAFGYAVEFLSIDAIRRRFGPDGIIDPVLEQDELVVSDDTQMTLFTLEGLLNNPEGSPVTWLESIRAAYLNWLATQTGGKANGWLATQKLMRTGRAPGNTCLSALGRGGHGTMEDPINDSKGCGGVMRVAPIGVMRSLGADAAFRLAAEAAALTHGHPSGYLSAGVMAAAIRHLMNGTKLRKAVTSSLEILMTYPGHKETVDAVTKALELATTHREDHVSAIQTLGGGWVGEEALAIAVYSVLLAKDFVGAVRIAANHSGDSDSTASIAGQLWGAMNGLEGMPNSWISALDVRVPALHLARQLIPHI